MKITIDTTDELSKQIVSIQRDVATMDELAELFVDISLALGYHPNTVFSYLAPERLEDE